MMKTLFNFPSLILAFIADTINYWFHWKNDDTSRRINAIRANEGYKDFALQKIEDKWNEFKYYEIGLRIITRAHINIEAKGGDLREEMQRVENDIQRLQLKHEMWEFANDWHNYMELPIEEVETDYNKAIERLMLNDLDKVVEDYLKEELKKI